MKALYKESGKFGLTLRNIANPHPSEKMALIQVHCAGICGTDLHFYTEHRELPKAKTIILGHEIAGVVCELFDQDQNLPIQIGDHVVVDMLVGCGTCSQCTIDYKLDCRQSERIGITVNGGFAEYTIVPVANLCKLPGNLTFEQGVFADPLACAYKGVDKLANKQISRVLILGGGIIGIFCLQLLQQLRAVKEIIIVDRHTERLEFAKHWGAIGVSDLNDIAQPGEQFDLVIEASGSANLFNSGLTFLGPRGIFLLLGLHLQSPTVDTFKLLQREIEIIPSLCYSHHQMEVAIELLSQRVIDVEPMISAMFPLNRHEQAFDAALKKELMKVLFQVN